jgi:hypothetical protein
MELIFTQQILHNCKWNFLMQINKISSFKFIKIEDITNFTDHWEAPCMHDMT